MDSPPGLHPNNRKPHDNDDKINNGNNKVGAEEEEEGEGMVECNYACDFHKDAEALKRAKDMCLAVESDDEGGGGGDGGGYAGY